MPLATLGVSRPMRLHSLTLGFVLCACGGSSSGTPGGAEGAGGATADATASGASDATGDNTGSFGTGPSSATSGGGAGSGATASGASDATGDNTGSFGTGPSSATSVGGAAGASDDSVGSGGANSGVGGSAGAGVQCWGSDNLSFPEFDRSCATASDCVLVQHVTSCCGSVLVEAIAAIEQRPFAEAEAICDSQYPACGCAAMGVDVEDGTLLPYGTEDQVEARCDDGTCGAHYTGTTFDCGTSLCIEGQYCNVTVYSSDGSMATACYASSCDDCSCMNQANCTCDSSDGRTTLTCTVP